MRLVSFTSTTLGDVWVNPEHVIFVSSEDDSTVLWLSAQTGQAPTGGGPPMQLHVKDDLRSVISKLSAV
jgi:hypothetical protein